MSEVCCQLSYTSPPPRGLPPSYGSTGKGARHGTVDLSNHVGSGALKSHTSCSLSPTVIIHTVIIIMYYHTPSSFFVQSIQSVEGDRRTGGPRDSGRSLGSTVCPFSRCRAPHREHGTGAAVWKHREGLWVDRKGTMEEMWVPFFAPGIMLVSNKQYLKGLLQIGLHVSCLFLHSADDGFAFRRCPSALQHPRKSESPGVEESHMAGSPHSYCSADTPSAAWRSSMP